MYWKIIMLCTLAMEQGVDVPGPDSMPVVCGRGEKRNFQLQLVLLCTMCLVTVISLIFPFVSADTLFYRTLFWASWIHISSAIYYNFVPSPLLPPKKCLNCLSCTACSVSFAPHFIKRKVCIWVIFSFLLLFNSLNPALWAVCFENISYHNKE